MKLNLFFGLLVLAVAIQKGESSITRTVVEQALEAVNTAAGNLSNTANDYLLYRLTNVTQIEEWSVNTQVKVFTGIAKLAFSGANLLQNLSIIDVKLLDCIVAEESPFLEALTAASITNGWCNNVLAGNLTRALQSVTQIMVSRNVEFKTYLDSLKSCLLGDDICFTQYLTKVVAYITSELQEGDTMLTAVEEVIKLLIGMYGEDAPRCNREYLFPLVAAAIHNSTIKIYECASS